LYLNLFFKKLFFFIGCVKKFDKFAAHFKEIVHLKTHKADIAQLARAADL
tara:strand:+ start:563 stop:712 length:150 start_codon:yes stop_codon:yes gene_type:complete